MTEPRSRLLPEVADELAPDGSEVRRLCRTADASMAHFRFPAGTTSYAVIHRTVAEIWYVDSGAGEMWRRPAAGTAQTLPLTPGLSLEIPAGCAFQVKVDAAEPLDVVAVTVPPWPGDDEARRVSGPWDPDVSRAGAGEPRIR